MTAAISPQAYRALITPPKRNKYGAKPEIVDGIRFASKMEARRYDALKQLAKHKLIRNLTLQPRFPLYVMSELVCTYVGDFQYEEVGTGRIVTEDVKGLKTPVYRIKRKLFEAIYAPLTITEVRA